jgi:outer membrane protein
MYGRISISQLVYDFGATSLKIKMAKDLYESSKFEIDTEINNLVYEVRDKYYYLIFTKLQKRATEELSLEFKDQISLIKEHYKSHSAKTHCNCTEFENMGDMPIQELNIANTERLLNESQNDIELTQVKLNNIIGLPYLNPYKISDKLSDEKLEITSENLVKIANTSRPELKYAQKQIELAQKKEKSVIKDINPRLNLFGSYGGGGVTYQSESYNNYGSYQVGAMLSTPWINPVIVHKKLEEAKFAKNYEQATALEMAYNTYLEIQEAHISYNTEIKNIEKCKKTLEKAQKVLKIFKKMYADGEDCYIHVGEFTCIVFEAKINYYNALYKLNSAKAAMDKAVGKIITKEDIITNL